MGLTLLVKVLSDCCHGDNCFRDDNCCHSYCCHRNMSLFICLVDCDFTPSVDCSDRVNKYYYNSTTQMCQEILACDRPGNLFNSLEDCNQECPGVYVSNVSVCLCKVSVAKVEAIVEKCLAVLNICLSLHIFQTHMA